MVKATASPILQLIRRAVEDPRVRELSDQDLLQRFHAQQDKAAFSALLRRHGPMVLDVCRSALGNEADAEDAFQATFLILARKASSIRKTASLASWLHGVAYRTALKARAQSATRQKHEARAPARKPSEPDDLSWREVRQVLHEEVSGLAERYRAPLVLCYLEGATQEAAAVQLNLAKSTLRERLERGRTLLRTRLMRRGLGPAAVLVTAAWPAAHASACVPTSVVSSTVKAANLFAAGQTAAVGLIPAKVAALTEGVLQTMLLSKIKVATAVLLVVAAVGVGGNRLLVATRAAERADEPKQVQPDKPQPPPPKDKPRIEFIQSRDGEFWKEALLVRDPSSGEFKALTREDGIPVLKGYIEFHVKKLKEAKDDKSIREALKSLEQSVQDMKDLLSLPRVPAEKKPEDKKPEKPPGKLGAAAESEADAKPLALQVAFADSDEDDLPMLRQVRPRRFHAEEVQKPQPPTVRFPLVLRIADRNVQLPGDWYLQFGDIGVITRVRLRGMTKAEAISIVKNYIELHVQNLKEAKDDKSIREALEALMESVQTMKELLSFGVPAERKPDTQALLFQPRGPFQAKQVWNGINQTPRPRGGDHEIVHDETRSDSSCYFLSPRGSGSGAG